jgi:hypothetical protein
MQELVRYIYTDQVENLEEFAVRLLFAADLLCGFHETVSFG